ncbi:hypothetical protein [Rhizobium sp. 18065]|uniref:hypothetical protein n=1 Tax=Rhizobium sp. 18065 TaxID=2681411 RepID=UPI001FCE9092|nr:hypothetical protein [Rhizobium sp. 18065]
MRQSPPMSTWIEIIPWVLALPPALWELRNVRKSYGWILGACAGLIVFGGLFLWIFLLWLSAANLHNLNYGAIGVVQVFGLLLGPPAAAVFMAKRSGLAAGVFAGVVVGSCVLYVTIAIGIGVYGK